MHVEADEQIQRTFTSFLTTAQVTGTTGQHS